MNECLCTNANLFFFLISDTLLCPYSEKFKIICIVVLKVRENDRNNLDIFMVAFWPLKCAALTL